MARHNTHRAAGRAVTPLKPELALRGVGGAAVLSTAVVGSIGTANAVQVPATAPAAPSAATLTLALPTQAPAVAPQLTSTAISPGVVLGRGHTGSRVKQLQAALNNNGASLVVDGIFGPRTHSAVVSYQRANNLMVDGLVGRQTRGALNAGIGSSKSNAEDTSADKANGAGRGSSRGKAPEKPKPEKPEKKGSIGSRSSQASDSAILETARSQIGVRYQWGGDSTSGFDCSGFTQWVYKKHGISLRHSSYSQANGGRRISRAEARPGDLVAWPGHVGIYAGNGRVIDAGMTPQKVSERKIWGSPKFISYR